jgi:hypothetical protein
MMSLLHWRVVVNICVVLIVQSTQRDNLSMLIFFFFFLAASLTHAIPPCAHQQQPPPQMAALLRLGSRAPVLQIAHKAALAPLLTRCLMLM